MKVYIIFKVRLRVRFGARGGHGKEHLRESVGQFVSTSVHPSPGPFFVCFVSSFRSVRASVLHALANVTSDGMLDNA